MGKSRKEVIPCRYSPSCFECPMPDCVASPDRCVNEILSSEFWLELLPVVRSDSRKKKTEGNT